MVSQSSSVGYTIMGKTADLTVVQKMTLTPCTRKARRKRSLQKRLAVHRALCPSTLIERRREGKECGEQKCTINRDNRTLERIVKQTHSKCGGDSQRVDCSWSQCFKNHYTDVCKTWVSAVAFLVSSHSWTTDSVRSVSPGLKTKRTGLLLSGPKLCSLMKVILHFLWKSGSQSLEEERRGTESTLLEVQCKVSTVSDGLGCHVICWCWSTLFSEVQGQHSRIPGSFRALHASCCWPTLWRCRFHFPTGLGTCTQCQSYQYLV